MIISDVVSGISTFSPLPSTFRLSYFSDSYLLESVLLSLPYFSELKLLNLLNYQSRRVVEEPFGLLRVETGYLTQ